MAGWIDRALPAAVLVAIVGTAAGARAQEKSARRGLHDYDYRHSIQNDIRKYCGGCHGKDATKGGVDLMRFETVEQVRREPELWDNVRERLRAGDMPPEGKPQMSDRAKGLVLELVDFWLAQADEVRDPGQVTARRLNRAEYDFTIEDLTGLPLRLAERFPPDQTGYGFDNVGDLLFTTPTQASAYLSAAEAVVDAVLAGGRPGADPAQRRAYRRIFEEPVPSGAQGDEAARAILNAFLERAMRGQAPASWRRRAWTLYQGAGRGDPLPMRLRPALVATLCAPEFLFRLEDRPGAVEPYRLTDHQIATRLSYFLWISTPDDRLLRLARGGKLRDERVLRQEVARLVADPRSARFVSRFVRQWLELGKLVEGGPSREVFPEFDDALRAAMLAEPEAVFARVLGQNRSILELLDGGHTFVNERLAAHYGIEGMEGEPMRLVSLEGTGRGGVLGMAGVLAATSYPHRTSPVLRGEWILRQILGAPTPPPPPNVPGLAEAKAEGSQARTLRERLAHHRRNPECAGCHARMDPLGFALENFDAVGRWRDTDAGAPVDASAQLPGGVRFTGPAGLRQVLRDRRREFVTAFTRQMLTFALGRPLDFFDRSTVKGVVAALERDGYRLHTLVGAIVGSYPFSHRRNAPILADGGGGSAKE